ncbi:MAG: hypothetical protein ACLQU4_15805 [Limisphaerales bacterium]
MKKSLIRLGIGVFALVVTAIVASIFCLGGLLKNRVESVGPRVAQVSVKLDSADVWLLTGRARLKGLSIGNPPGCKTQTAIQAGLISVRLDAMSALSSKPIIDSIVVQSPEITIEGGLRNNNLTRILKNVNASVSSSQAESSPSPFAAPGKPGRKFQVNDLLITGARLRFASLLYTGASVTVPLPEIHLVNLGAGPAGITAPEIAQKTLIALLDSIAASGADAVGKLGNDAASTAKKFDLKKAAEKLKGLFGQ